jgi:hypothetical protein
MPLFEMKRLQDSSIDVTYSSHAMIDIEPVKLISYLKSIHHITRNRFLFLGTSAPPQVPGLIGGDSDLFRLQGCRNLCWNSHRYPRVQEVECLYAFDHANSCALSAEGKRDHVDR